MKFDTPEISAVEPGLTRRLLVALAAAAGLALASPATAQQTGQASRYYEDAQARFDKNDIAGAVIQLKNALQQDPNLLAAYVLLGKAQLAIGDAAGAETAFSKSLVLGVDRTEVAVPMAQALFDQGKYDTLLERFPAEGLPDSKRAQLLVLRGHAYKGLGDTQAALREFEAARKVDPRFAPALLSEGELLAERGRHAEAQKLADEAILLVPGEARLWNLKGLLATSAGDSKAALDAYGKALAIDPKLADARISRVSLFINLGRDADAAKDLAYLKANNPDDPRAAYLRAVYAGRRGDGGGARDALHEVVRVIDPVPREIVRKRAPQFLLLGGVAHYSLGSAEKARSYLEDYLKIAPGHVGARRVLGAAYLELGDARSAISALEPARRAAPDDVEVLALLATAHIARREYQTATDYLERALKLSGGAPSVHATLGLSLLGIGQSELGVEHLQAAFKKDPGNPRAGIALSVLYLKTGKPKQAAEVAEVVVKHDPKNPAMINLMGVARAAAGDHKGARAAYEQAARLEPGFVAPKLNLAKLDLSEDKLESARARLQALLKDRPKDTQAMYELAGAEVRAGRSDEAIRWLEKVHSLDPGNITAAARLVDLYLARKNPDKALTVAKDAEGVAPENLTALAALGRTYLALGNQKTARNVFDRMIRLASFDPAWLTQIARYQLAAGNEQGAIHSLEKALEGRPDYVPAQVLHVEIDLASGETAKAETRAKAIVKSNPKLAVGYRLEADIAFSKKDFPRAIQGYRTALAKEETTDSALRLFGALIESGDTKKAIEFMSSWVAAHPKDMLALRALAQGYLREGNLAAARVRYEQVLQSSGDDPFALNNLANILARQNDRGARELAEKAYRLAPKNALIQDTLGWILVQEGQIEAGLRHLREARLRDPQNPEIRYHLAAALSRAGRPVEARRELEPAMASDKRFEGNAEARRLWAELDKP
jgi:putative PEP-CTERM system TPR-repeat lipoprotein